MTGRRAGIAVLVTMLASVAVGHAQRRAEFGVFAGGTFSRFGGDDIGEFDKTRVGVAVGGSVALSLGPYFSIQPELLFAQKGAENGTDGSFTISYVELPVLAKFRLPAQGNGRQFSPHFYVGGAVGLKAGCTARSGSTSDSCEDAGVDMKSTDVSLVVGAGVDIGRAMLGARYDIGLSKIQDAATPEDVKNRAFYLLVGWAFRAPR